MQGRVPAPPHCLPSGSVSDSLLTSVKTALHDLAHMLHAELRMIRDLQQLAVAQISACVI